VPNVTKRKTLRILHRKDHSILHRSEWKFKVSVLCIYYVNDILEASNYVKMLLFQFSFLNRSVFTEILIIGRFHARDVLMSSWTLTLSQDDFNV